MDQLIVMRKVSQITFQFLNPMTKGIATFCLLDQDEAVMEALRISLFYEHSSAQTPEIPSKKGRWIFQTDNSEYLSGK